MSVTLVLGCGLTGTSIIRFLAAQGQERLWAADSRRQHDISAVLPYVERVHTGTLPADWLSQVQRIIVSPGVSETEFPLSAYRQRGISIFNDIYLFAQAVQAPVLAITGTNGKSTVAALVHDLLLKAGYHTALGGNFGTPALSLLNEAVDYYILELSSFQLDESHGALAAQAAVVLNIMPDHCDRYTDMQIYRASKLSVFAQAQHGIYCLDQPESAPLNPVCTLTSFSATNQTADWSFDGNDMTYQGKAICSTESWQSHATHQRNNYLAAAALVHSIDITPEVLTEVFSQTTGLPHRCERLGTWHDIEYINDSKATNCAAVRAAIEAVQHCTGRIFWLGGGQLKEDQESVCEILLPVLKRAVYAGHCFGQAAQQFAQYFQDQYQIHQHDSLEAAANAARRHAHPGDLILLSPGGASFDQFSGYVARGNCFRTWFHALK